MSFARCVESLGRKSPTFEELKKDSMVLQAMEDAWKASDVRALRPLVPHEEGGWIFMNLITGSLSIKRGAATHTDAFKLEPGPDAEENNVLVATFHTHPTMVKKPGPSDADKKADNRRGVPNLVVCNKGTKPDEFQIKLSGPPVRKHLASKSKFPGASGGDGP